MLRIVVRLVGTNGKNQPEDIHKVCASFLMLLLCSSCRVASFKRNGGARLSEEAKIAQRGTEHDLVGHCMLSKDVHTGDCIVMIFL